MGKTFRLCVVGVFINQDGRILIAKRTDKEDVWQLPQGGVDPGESYECALKREMKEELGVEDLKILRSSQKSHCYTFPETLTAPIVKKFKGQEQRWFLCQLLHPATINLDLATDKEFCDYKWVEVSECVQKAVEWKRQTYMDGLRDLELL